MKIENTTNLLEQYKNMKKLNTYLLYITLILLITHFLSRFIPNIDTNNTLHIIHLIHLILVIFSFVMFYVSKFYLDYIKTILKEHLINDNYITITENFVQEYKIKEYKQIKKQYQIRHKLTNKYKKHINPNTIFYLYQDIVQFNDFHDKYQYLINEIAKNYNQYHIYFYYEKSLQK